MPDEAKPGEVEIHVVGVRLADWKYRPDDFAARADAFRRRLPELLEGEIERETARTAPDEPRLEAFLVGMFGGGGMCPYVANDDVVAWFYGNHSREWLLMGAKFGRALMPGDHVSLDPSSQLDPRVHKDAKGRGMVSEVLDIGPSVHPLRDGPRRLPGRPGGFVVTVLFDNDPSTPLQLTAGDLVPCPTSPEAA